MGDRQITHYVKTGLEAKPLIEQFLNSPYISDKIDYRKIRSALMSAYEIAFNENDSLLRSITVNKKKLTNYVEKLPDNEEFTDKQLLEIIDFIDEFLKHFPDLKYEFLESVVIFQFKCVEDQTEEIKKEIKSKTFKHWKWEECECKNWNSNYYYVSVIGINPMYSLYWSDYEYLQYVEKKVLEGSNGV